MWTREGLQQMDKRMRKLMTMCKALHLRDDIDGLYVSRKEGRRGLTRIQDSVEASIQRLHKKAQMKTDYSHQKQYRQHKHRQNKNNQKTKIGRKTTVWTFQATNNGNLTREDLDMAMKGEP